MLYEDNQYVSTTLLSGSVKLNYKGSNNQENNIVMQPGQKIYYDELSKTELGCFCKTISSIRGGMERRKDYIKKYIS